MFLIFIYIRFQTNAYICTSISKHACKEYMNSQQPLVLNSSEHSGIYEYIYSEKQSSKFGTLAEMKSKGPKLSHWKTKPMTLDP